MPVRLHQLLPVQLQQPAGDRGPAGAFHVRRIVRSPALYAVRAAVSAFVRPSVHPAVPAIRPAAHHHDVQPDVWQ